MTLNARSESGRGAELFALTASLLLSAAMSGCSPDYPACDNDDDCKQGEFCVNNLCQQCRGNEDCGPGQQCNAGACEAIAGYCTSSSQCGPGQECQNNMCVAQTQSSLPDDAPAATGGACELTSVYFDFDSSTLADTARDQLSRNASCIRERGVSGVHLTGLTDPRGTEEYNLALGDRRAQSAQQYLKSLGAADVSYSSMGEELASGADEGTWARDRRVDFKVK